MLERNIFRVNKKVKGIPIKKNKNKCFVVFLNIPI